ncbi:unnamed protein product, partial [Didymodactylos carnosus]
MGSTTTSTVTSALSFPIALTSAPLNASSSSPAITVSSTLVLPLALTKSITSLILEAGTGVAYQTTNLSQDKKTTFKPLRHFRFVIATSSSLFPSASTNIIPNAATATITNASLPSTTPAISTTSIGVIFGTTESNSTNATPPKSRTLAITTPGSTSDINYAPITMNTQTPTTTTADTGNKDSTASSMYSNVTLSAAATSVQPSVNVTTGTDSTQTLISPTSTLPTSSFAAFSSNAWATGSTAASAPDNSSDSNDTRETTNSQTLAITISDIGNKDSTASSMYSNVTLSAAATSVPPSVNVTTGTDSTLTPIGPTITLTTSTFSVFTSNAWATGSVASSAPYNTSDSNDTRATTNSQTATITTADIGNKDSTASSMYSNVTLSAAATSVQPSVNLTTGTDRTHTSVGPPGAMPTSNFSVLTSTAWISASIVWAARSTAPSAPDNMSDINDSTNSQAPTLTTADIGNKDSTASSLSSNVNQTPVSPASTTTTSNLSAFTSTVWAAGSTAPSAPDNTSDIDDTPTTTNSQTPTRTTADIGNKDSTASPMYTNVTLSAAATFVQRSVTATVGTDGTQTLINPTSTLPTSTFPAFSSNAWATGSAAPSTPDKTSDSNDDLATTNSQTPTITTADISNNDSTASPMYANVTLSAAATSVQPSVNAAAGTDSTLTPIGPTITLPTSTFSVFTRNVWATGSTAASGHSNDDNSSHSNDTRATANSQTLAISISDIGNKNSTASSMYTNVTLSAAATSVQPSVNPTAGTDGTQTSVSPPGTMPTSNFSVLTGTAWISASTAASAPDNTSDSTDTLVTTNSPTPTITTADVGNQDSAASSMYSNVTPSTAATSVQHSVNVTANGTDSTQTRISTVSTSNLFVLTSTVGAAGSTAASAPDNTSDINDSTNSQTPTITTADIGNKDSTASSLSSNVNQTPMTPTSTISTSNFSVFTGTVWAAGSTAPSAPDNRSDINDTPTTTNSQPPTITTADIRNNDSTASPMYTNVTLSAAATSVQPSVNVTTGTDSTQTPMGPTSTLPTSTFAVFTSNAWATGGAAPSIPDKTSDSNHPLATTNSETPTITTADIGNKDSTALSLSSNVNETPISPTSTISTSNFSAFTSTVWAAGSTARSTHDNTSDINDTPTTTNSQTPIITTADLGNNDSTASPMYTNVTLSAAATPVQPSVNVTTGTDSTQTPIGPTGTLPTSTFAVFTSNAWATGSAAASTPDKTSDSNDTRATTNSQTLAITISDIGNKDSTASSMYTNVTLSAAATSVQPSVNLTTGTDGTQTSVSPPGTMPTSNFSVLTSTACISANTAAS